MNTAIRKCDAILSVTTGDDELLLEHIGSLEKALSWSVDIQSGDDSEDVTFEIEDGLLERVCRNAPWQGLSAKPDTE
jgi:hypothetical protein